MPSSYRPRGAPAHAGRRRAIRGEVILDERTRQRLRRTRLRRAAVVLGVFLGVIGAVALYRSPLLRVQEVQVVGTVNLDAATVAELADLEAASMFDPPLGSAEKRIAGLPLVKSAKAERHWPQTVRIEVTERLPWGYWRIGDTSYVIDADGVVLPQVQPPEGATVIDDRGGPVKLLPGDRVDVDAVALAQVLLQRVPEVLGLNVAALEYTPQAGLSLVTDGGYRVVVGDSQNVDFKLAVWRAVEADLGREAMAGHVLDLRFEDRPSFQ